MMSGLGPASNLAIDCDSYKCCHWLCYPPGTTRVHSYIESRGGKFPNTLFFGLQAYLKAYLSKPVIMADVMEAANFWREHGLPFNEDGWAHIVYKHGGYLPIRVRAVREGTVLPTHNAMVTVENTDPAVPWVTSWLETSMLRSVWYPTTVASVSYQCRQLILSYLNKTCDNPAAEIDFKLHDFGYRGVSSKESAGIGGMAHLVNFKGTDTTEAIRYAKFYYGAKGMPAFSIPAAEHSTITSWGREGEAAAYRNMLQKFPNGLVAVVSDSYDIYHASRQIWGTELRNEVMNRSGTVVIRPDSGIPHEVVVNVLKILWERFGGTVNSKGYRVLHPSVRVIQGDGINYDSLGRILGAVMDAGFSVENAAFGMGGGLLQQCDRDTMKFAMKCSAIESDGVWRDVYKQPATDLGKVSKKGRQALVKIYHGGGGYTWETGPEKDYPAGSNLLEKVYEDGEITLDQSFEDIRALAASFGVQPQPAERAA
jgi:nicotinamide phosphoribosyltransferase